MVQSIRNNFIELRHERINMVRTAYNLDGTIRTHEFLAAVRISQQDLAASFTVFLLTLAAAFPFFFCFSSFFGSFHAAFTENST